MLSSREKYLNALRDKCNEIKLDFFLQGEANEFIHRVFTMEDIYLPLSLQNQVYEEGVAEFDLLSVDYAEIENRINERIAQLEDSKDSKDSTEVKRDIRIVVSNTRQREKGMGLLITADPGSGKTTFCKKLILAIIKNETSFFEKYHNENNLFFDPAALPVYIDCKDISEQTEETIKKTDFDSLLMKLAKKKLGNHFPDISDKEFYELLHSDSGNRNIIILDGWDELFDQRKADLFQVSLNQYLNDNTNSDIVVTLRKSFIGPKLTNRFTSLFSIMPLSNEDIRKFCEKWQTLILNRQIQPGSEESTIADQILRSTESQVQLMMKNPLELSLLLVVSRAEGKLPTNKAELFERLVDLYIYWGTTKSELNLPRKAIKVFLAYIATIFTKWGIFNCDNPTLVKIIKQCRLDLKCVFADKIINMEPEEIIPALIHSGILSNTYEGRGYSFVEGDVNRMHSHRQMQEYLTAYAILASYADEEYNSMPSPVDILESKIAIPYWKEIIIFVALMGKKRVRNELIQRLLKKCAENNQSQTCSNILFEIVLKGAFVIPSDRHKIYDINFSNHMMSHQVSEIYYLVKYRNDNSEDFISYIDTSFRDSVQAGRIKYQFVEAVVQSTLAIASNISPFCLAEKLMDGKQDSEMLIGFYILRIMAWCKYSALQNPFESYYFNFNMPVSWITKIKKIIKENAIYRTTILQSIQDAIIAGFVRFEDLFSPADVRDCISGLGDIKRRYDSEIVLSMVPLFDNSYKHVSVDEKTKMLYMFKLSREKLNRIKGDILFTFVLCCTIGCWNDFEMKKHWESLEKIFKDEKTNGNKHLAYYNMLKTEFQKKNENLDSFNPVFSQGNSHKVKGKYTDDKEGLIVCNEAGKEVVCDILYTFDSEDTEKSYIVYTDNTRDESGKVRVYASTYTPESDDPDLKEIETKKEWDIIAITLQEVVTGFFT